MPLSAVNFVPLTGNIKAADLRGFFDLFTGAMTDQPVTFANTLQVGGSQGAGVPPIRIVGVAAQTANMIEARALAADVQPIFSVGPTGTLSWGPGAAVGPDVSLRRSAPNQLTLQGLAGTPALVIPVGGLQVSAGNVGIGGPPLANVGVFSQGVLTAISGSAQGLQSNNTLTASANNDTLYGIIWNGGFNDNGKTGVRHVPMWAGGTGLMWFLDSWTAAAGFFSGGFTADGAYHSIASRTVVTNGGALVVHGVTPPLTIGTAAGQVFVGVSIDGGAITGYSRFNPVQSLNSLPVHFVIAAPAAGTHTITVSLNCATGMGTIGPDGGAGNSAISFWELR